QHLNFIASRRNANFVGKRQGEGKAADVVTAEGRPQQRVVLHQEARQALVVGVGLGFVQENRNRPTLLGRQHRLVIPIRALDEPDPYGTATPLDPAGQFFEVGGAVL